MNFLFRNFIETVLNPATTNPRELIAMNKDFLSHLSMGGEDDGTKEEVMETFFEF